MYQKYCDTYKTKKAYIESFGSKMERGVSRGKREVCPVDQATRKGLGNLDSLDCYGQFKQREKRSQ